MSPISVHHVTIVGADPANISPRFNLSGGAAFRGASILFKPLCVMAGVTPPRG
ncbi:hypothetical protein [Roseovarius sp. MBR-6]|uniref:hypothetical protein n=1 Tax=Roseovarius sp. MBR-6 TaxID=3156459 RepID=UPI003397B9FF